MAGDAIVADGKPRKKSKTTKMAKAAAVAGGLDWASLSKEQRAQIKDAVRQDRAARKLEKKLHSPASSGSLAAAALSVDPTLLKAVLPGTSDPAAAVAEIKKAFARPHSGDGWR